MFLISLNLSLLSLQNVPERGQDAMVLLKRAASISPTLHKNIILPLWCESLHTTHSWTLVIGCASVLKMPFHGWLMVVIQQQNCETNWQLHFSKNFKKIYHVIYS